MSRKKFIQSYGATCANWTWSWSFVNHAEKLVIFGAWDLNTKDDKEVILGEGWKTLDGRKQPGYSQALDHVKLIENSGYKLMTFRLIYSDKNKDKNGFGPAKIKGFIPDLKSRTLRKIGREWFALPIQTEEKVARICWNTNNWQRPSGRLGKSKDKDSYELINGFGHEEWLLDNTKPINGYHYGYLEAIGAHRDLYLNKVFNIHLYSINTKTKQRWWIGQIKNVQVTTVDESISIYNEYKRNGWLEEMKNQVVAVEGNKAAFELIKPEFFAVIKYKARDLDLLDHPMEFSSKDKAVTSHYYNLKDFISLPKPTIKREFEFRCGHRTRAKTAQHKYSKQDGEKDLQHNCIQETLYNLLVEKYGRSNVGTENNAGNGTFIDVVTKNDQKYTFFEIKTSATVIRCIREAIGQLLEYAHYEKNVDIESLVVVGEQPVTKEANSYLIDLKKRYKLPLTYKQIKIESMELI